ncbi:MAG: hypothetical protein DWQ36_11080 [Acidobacteria bacterium]|nr:MAG: hypothetical protein DWQ30_12320 [Acidobacteriota bacterium]REK07753.1 MAG: hypothetical protein DWQ36_11080 [Acidobacteriota bacterium]
MSDAAEPSEGWLAAAGGRWARTVARIVGDPESNPLEVRFLNGVSLIAFLATAVMVTVNLLLIEQPWLDVTLAALASACSGVTYWLSRHHGLGQRLATPFYVVLLGLVSASWFSNEGLVGSATYVFFTLLVGGVVLLPHRGRLLWVGLSLAMAGALIVVHRRWPELLFHYQTPGHRFLDVSVYLVLCLAIVSAIVLTLHREHERERQRSADLYARASAENRKLQEALAKIHVLEGLLPICAHCKSIQDSQGRWREMEIYLADRGAVRLSHGICGQCNREFYSEFLDDEDSGALS